MYSALKNSAMSASIITAECLVICYLHKRWKQTCCGKLVLIICECNTVARKVEVYKTPDICLVSAVTQVFPSLVAPVLYRWHQFLSDPNNQWCLTIKFSSWHWRPGKCYLPVVGSRWCARLPSQPRVNTYCRGFDLFFVQYIGMSFFSFNIQNFHPLPVFWIILFSVPRSLTQNI